MKKQCRQCLAPLPAFASLCPRCCTPVPDEPLVVEVEQLPPRAEVVERSEPVAAAAPAEVRVATTPATGPASVQAIVARQSEEPRSAEPERAGLTADFRRAFQVESELRAARVEVGGAEVARRRALEDLGELAWRESLASSAPAKVVEQLRRLDAQTGDLEVRLREIESVLASHDATAESLQVEASAAIAATAKDQKSAEANRDRIAAELREIESKLEEKVETADRDEARVRALQAESDGLGSGTIRAEQRIAREAEIERERLEREGAARDARQEAAALEHAVGAKTEELATATADVGVASKGLHEARQRLDQREAESRRARESLVASALDVRGMLERARTDRKQLFATLGTLVVAGTDGRLAALQVQVRSADAKLAEAQRVVARLETERSRLRTIRTAAVAAGVVVIVILVALAYALVQT